MELIVSEKLRIRTESATETYRCFQVFLPLCDSLNKMSESLSNGTQMIAR
jgi:hypothetical protein